MVKQSRAFKTEPIRCPSLSRISYGTTLPQRRPATPRHSPAEPPPAAHNTFPLIHYETGNPGLRPAGARRENHVRPLSENEGMSKGEELRRQTAQQRPRLSGEELKERTAAQRPRLSGEEQKRRTAQHGAEEKDRESEGRDSEQLDLDR